MAGGAHTFGKWRDGALREDVTDEIFQITPTDTPFYSVTGDADASNPMHQWSTRALAARAVNAVQEGANYTTVNVNLPTRVGNLLQILRKLASASYSLQASTAVGIEDVMADQSAVALTEWKNDCEFNLLKSTLTTGNSDATARKMGGYLQVVGPANNRFDYNSSGTFGEDMFINLLESIWSDGGKPTDVLVNSKLKRKIGTFNFSATKNILAEDKRVVSIVNVLETDFGIVEAQLCRDLGNATGTYQIAAFDRSFLKKAWLRRPSIKVIPETRDATDAVVIGEVTLEYGNKDALGLQTEILHNGL